MYIDVNDQQHATILAALRFYQENGQGDPAQRSNQIHAIATNEDRVISLDDEGIDELCEKLNTTADENPRLSILMLNDSPLGIYSSEKTANEMAVEDKKKRGESPKPYYYVRERTLDAPPRL